MQESHKIIDQDLSSAELSKLINHASDIFLLCLEAILHHTEIEEFAPHILLNDGLNLLLEVYNRQKTNLMTNILLSRIFSNISVLPGVLKDIHKSGNTFLHVKETFNNYFFRMVDYNLRMDES